MIHRTNDQPGARKPRLTDESGLTLLEVMISAIILLFVLLSMVSGYALGRVNLDREEVKRRAVGLAQDRLETIRGRSITSNAAWLAVVPARVDTTYVLDGTTFRLTSAVADSPANTATTKPVQKIVTVDVGWTVYKRSGTAARTIRAQTVLFKDFITSNP